jgi:hypothetical protein
MANRSYAELADAAERGELHRKPGTRRVGAAAAQIARDVLMEATGADPGLGALVALTEDLGLYDERMPMPPSTRAE